MPEYDIRWHQRLSNYSKALIELTEAVTLANQRELSKLEKQGLIQAFEYTHELAWKTIKDFLEARGNSTIFGSRDASSEAFRLGIITDGQIWMNMIKSRNQTSHTYDEAVAQEIVSMIIETYFNQFKFLEQKFLELKSHEVY